MGTTHPTGTLIVEFWLVMLISAKHFKSIPKKLLISWCQLNVCIKGLHHKKIGTKQNASVWRQLGYQEGGTSTGWGIIETRISSNFHLLNQVYSHKMIMFGEFWIVRFQILFNECGILKLLSWWCDQLGQINLIYYCKRFSFELISVVYFL